MPDVVAQKPKSIEDVSIPPANLSRLMDKGFARIFLLTTEGVSPRRLVSWTTKGVMAILDQGLITGSNFLLSILLARWLSREQYGAFALGFAIFLLVAMLYQSLLLEPMAVFGGSVYRRQLRSYLSALLKIHFVAGLGIFVALGMSAELVHLSGQAGSGLPGALAGASVGAPFILLLWFARRAFYLQLSSAFAVAGALLYCTLVIGGLVFARAEGFLSTFTAFALMGGGGLVASALLLVCLNSRLVTSTNALRLQDVWKRHWVYGCWALASAAAMWLPANLYYALLSSFSGVASAGELKALMNFASPVFQFFAAISLLLLPYAAQRRDQGAPARVLSWKITILSVSAAVAYWAVLLLLRRPAFRLFYAGRYMEVVHLLPVVALGSVFETAFFGPAIVLRSMTSPKSVFAALSAASLFSVVVGVPATWAFGVAGAVWAMTLSAGIALVAAVLLLQRKLQAPHAIPIKDNTFVAVAQ